MVASAKGKAGSAAGTVSANAHASKAMGRATLGIDFIKDRGSGTESAGASFRLGAVDGVIGFNG